MFWLILCIGIAATYALSAILDNYLIDVFYKNKNAEAIKAINSPFYFALGIIMIALFGIHINSPITALIAAGSGALISLASIPYIRALKNEEATTASIFYQLQPLIFLLIDVSILQKAITGNDMLGFVVTLLAPIVVIASAHRKGHRIDFSSAILFVLYDIFAVASSAIFAYLGKNNDAWTIYGFYIFGRGFCDFCLTHLIPSWHKRDKYVRKRYGMRLLLIQGSNLIIYTGADFLMRYVYTIAPTSLSSVVINALELIFTFLLGIILTIFWPKLGREKLNRHTIIAHAIAVFLAVIGIIILN